MLESSARRLAAILFADITGYTAMMQHDEEHALGNLARFKQSLEATTPKYHGQIIQYYGDGCLTVFDSPIQAVACAQVLQATFQEMPQLPVRIGIHLGDVVFAETNVFGDAVNIASRIESLGVPGSVLLSQTVRQQIKNHPEFQLTSLGNFDFKNVDEPIEVFALSNEGLAIPQRERMEGKLKPAIPIAKPRSPVWKRIAFIAVALLLGLTGWTIWQNATRSPISSDLKFEKSIAVLPFRNESTDKVETQYFCNGVMESILNDLSQIRELRVISRQSTERYRKSEKSIAEIAKELGVAHLLEGSVQRSGKQIKINAQLIYAATDQHLWAKTFIGEMDDIFALQSQIARDIAIALQAAIAPQEKERIERIPTVNMEAWNTYLEAHAAYIDYFFNHASMAIDQQNEEERSKVLMLCDRVLALDSTLAEAWTLKAQVWWPKHFMREFLGENFADTIALFSRKALKFDPHSALANSLLGQYLLGHGQPELGKKYLEKSVALNPNQFQAHLQLGNYYRDRGEYGQALFSLNSAMKLAPNTVWSPLIFLDLGDFYLCTGDLEKSKAFFLKAKAISNTPYIESMVVFSLAWLNTVQGKFGEAAELYENLKQLDTLTWRENIPILYSYGLDFEKALTGFKKLNETSPHGVMPNAKLRWAYALWKSGDKKAGMEMFRTAEQEILKLIKLGRNWDLNYDLASLYTFLGQKEKAWHYLRAYDKAGAWNWGLPYFIQVDPLFENLHHNAEFKQMIKRVIKEKAQLQAKLHKLEKEGKLF